MFKCTNTCTDSTVYNNKNIIELIFQQDYMQRLYLHARKFGFFIIKMQIFFAMKDEIGKTTYKMFVA